MSRLPALRSIALAIALTLPVAACILGPKQDDPSSSAVDPNVGDTGFAADVPTSPPPPPSDTGVPGPGGGADTSTGADAGATKDGCDPADADGGDGARDARCDGGDSPPDARPDADTGDGGAADGADDGADGGDATGSD